MSAFWWCRWATARRLRLRPCVASKATRAITTMAMTMIRATLIGSPLLRRRPRGHQDVVLRRLAGLELAPAFEFRVQLGPEQHREVRYPEPHEERHHAAERPVRLVVRGEARDVE